MLSSSTKWKRSNAPAGMTLPTVLDPTAYFPAARARTSQRQVRAPSSSNSPRARRERPERGVSLIYLEDEGDLRGYSVVSGSTHEGRGGGETHSDKKGETEEGSEGGEEEGELRSSSWDKDERDVVRRVI